MLLSSLQLKSSIFRTRVNCEGKLCNLIINGGGTEYVVFTELVKILGLKMEYKPKSYQLLWVDNYEWLVVKYQCILFFYWVYKKQVLCDMVPMSATYILLSVPDFFDRSVQHDARANTYYFIYYKKLLILTLMQYDEPFQKRSRLVRHLDKGILGPYPAWKSPIISHQDRVRALRKWLMQSRAFSKAKMKSWIT